MPLMRPPHYQGVRYNAAEVSPGAFVSILPQDVDALIAEGWELVSHTAGKLPPRAVVEFDAEE